MYLTSYPSSVRVMSAKKEIDSVKELLKTMESKASVASTRLRAEVEAHRETRETLDSTMKELIEVMHVND